MAFTPPSPFNFSLCLDSFLNIGWGSRQNLLQLLDTQLLKVQFHESPAPTRKFLNT